MGDSLGKITPQDFTEEMFDDPDMAGIEDFLAKVKVGTAWQITTARLLNLNGNSRRGKWVTREINQRLRQRGLICTPAIENADYYGTVVISDPRDHVRQSAEAVSVPLSSLQMSLGQLRHAGREMTVAKALSLMVSLDISQLPVLGSKQKTALGVVTWRGLAQRLAHGSAETVADVMEPPGRIAQSSDNVLDLVDTIMSRGFLLYTVPDGTVGGIVTVTDLVQSFNETTSLYLQLREIESRIRVLLDRVPLPKLKEHLEPRRQEKKEFRGAVDMMFGEYVSALSDPEVWTLIEVQFDQEYVTGLLDEVRRVRNDVMHFAGPAAGDDDLDSDLVSDEATSTQTNDVALLKALRVLRAIPL